MCYILGCNIDVYIYHVIKRSNKKGALVVAILNLFREALTME